MFLFFRKVTLIFSYSSEDDQRAHLQVSKSTLVDELRLIRYWDASEPRKTSGRLDTRLILYQVRHNISVWTIEGPFI